MTEKSALTLRQGIAAALLAYLLWGLVPIFFKRLTVASPYEVVAHRVVWSLLLMGMVLSVRGGYAAAQRLARQPRTLAWVVLAATMIAINWLTFIWGVAVGRILETSLGYFILPLLNVGLGVVLLKERLRRLQWLAVACALIGVIGEVLRSGHLPWISLVLAGSFGVYGLLHKRLPVDAASGLYLETACMTPLALAALIWMGLQGELHFGQNPLDDLLLAGAGVVTSVPLLLFAAAARRLPLTTMGFLQYLTPSISFLLAVFVYGEEMSAARLLNFAAIWCGLALYSVDLLRQTRAHPHPSV